MKPLVEATVADATGVMKATFFNQPWLERQYRPGHAAHARRQVPGPQPLPRQRTTRRPSEVAAVGDDGREYPATKGITSTQILALVREHRAAIDDVVEPLPGAAAARRAAARPRADALLAAHFGDHEGGRRRLAFDELLLDQLVQLRLRAERRASCARRAARPTRRR